MTGKYIDLLTPISESEEIGSSVHHGVKLALKWLDAHPDQVPGRTLTRSDMVEAFGEEYAGWATHCLARVGYTVAPDPEPTNAEKLTDELEAWGLTRSESLDLGAWLDGQGWAKATGERQ